MDTTTHLHKENQQTFRDFLDHGTIKDTRTVNPDGSRREPAYTPEAEKRRPLAPSPFRKAR